jgi:hypothetical protein
LFQEGDHFAHGAARTEIIAQFVEGRTEAGRRFNGSKTTHRIIALFDTTMILLSPIIEIFIGPMLDVAAQDLAYRPWIGAMPICCDRLWRMTNHRNSLLEKPLSSLHVPFLTQHGINQIAIVIDRRIPPRVIEPTSTILIPFLPA